MPHAERIARHDRCRHHFGGDVPPRCGARPAGRRLRRAAPQRIDRHFTRYLDDGALARVFTGGSDLKPVTAPLTEPMRIWHLLTHTSGLTHGFHHAHPVDALYRQHAYEWTMPPGRDLAACCEQWAALPLLFTPGTEWNYGVSTDVLGRVVEVVSGQPLEVFLRERMFDTLGMPDTGFTAPPERVAALCGRAWSATTRSAR
jgi:CubicO group peptidase (beta-lactamase class C family)